MKRDISCGFRNSIPSLVTDLIRRNQFLLATRVARCNTSHVIRLTCSKVSFLFVAEYCSYNYNYTPLSKSDEDLRGSISNRLPCL